MVGQDVAEGVERIVASNPGPLTGDGTNSYIVGTDRVALIDPGPDLPAHRDALLAALAGRKVAAILVTHAHLDHSGLAPEMAARTGAPVLAAGRATEGRSPSMEVLAASGLAGGGEGLDLAFVPDRRIGDGEVIAGSGWQIETIATPGHLATHMAFALGPVVFTGDHVMGWSTTIVSPPDGDMGAYMASLDRLSRQAARVYLPGHGAPITDPAARVAELVRHRRGREAAILARLGDQPQDAASLARAIYTDIAPSLLPAATRNVLAHLIDLHHRRLAAIEGNLATTARFTRA